MRAATLMLLAALAGCSGGGTAPPPATGDTRAYGVLYATREEALSPLAGATVDVSLGARIVRYAGIDRATVSEVLELSAFEADEVAPDECSEPLTAATIADLGGLETGAVVELVDVGPLEVRSGESVRLDARSFPDLLSVVSGVVYSGGGEGRPALASGSEVSFSGDGGDGIGAIEAVATFPAEIEGLRIGRQDPWTGTPALVRGGDLGVAWSAADATDEIRIEIEWVQPAGPVVIRCRAADDGEFIVPGARTRLVPELGGAGDPRMTVRRVRRTDVGATGLEDGALVLGQGVSFPLLLPE